MFGPAEKSRRAFRKDQVPMTHIELTSILTCPECGHAESEQMLQDV